MALYFGGRCPPAQKGRRTKNLDSGTCRPERMYLNIFMEPAIKILYYKNYETKFNILIKYLKSFKVSS